ARVIRRALLERADVIENPKCASLRGGYEIAIFHRQIRDGHNGQVQLETLPAAAIIKGNVDARFGSGEKKPWTGRILTNGAHKCVRRNPVYDERPRLAVIVRAINVRPEIIHLITVHRSIGGGRIVGGGLDNVDSRPRLDCRGRHIGPRFSSIACHVNQAVIGARPNGVPIHRRWGDGENRAIDIFQAPAIFARLVISGQVRTDGLPALALVGGFEHHVSAHINHARSGRGLGDRECPLKPILLLRAGSQQKYRFQWTFPIAETPAAPGVIYVGGNVVFKSTDQGESWQPISPDLTRNNKTRENGGRLEDVYCTVFTIAPSPVDRNTIWAGSDDGLIHVTRDG